MEPTVAPGERSVWVEAARHFEAWQAGRTEALDQLVRTLTPMLWQVVRASGLDRDHADDVVQTTWLTLVRHRENIHDPQALGGWLLTTARREAWRVSKLVSRDRPAEDVLLDHHTNPAVSAEVDVVQREEYAELWAGVSLLSERCQRLLRVLAFADHPDYRGLAVDLGMQVGSIGPTRGRCLRKLRSILEQAATSGGASWPT